MLFTEDAGSQIFKGFNLMCGIAGFMGGDTDLLIATRMSEMIESRGPDDSGVWVDQSSALALVHRRLSVQDLSLAGCQPMQSRSSRYVIVFNGEIYNHFSLRHELEMSGDYLCWKGHSDTETLLAGFEKWGVVATLERTVGMFAFALWDQQNAELHLARDRLGEKPLYYGIQKGIFIFASTLKAIESHPAFENQIDRNAIDLQLRYGYIPTPYSIYKGIKKLPSGALLTLASQNRQELFTELPIPKSYWSLGAVITKGRNNPFFGSDERAVETLESLLSDSVSLQMTADVPIGAMLSGGVDSSTIVALMQTRSLSPIKTFSIGYNEAGYNEAGYAKAVAQHLGTDHAELYVSAQQARDVIPLLPSIYDEPFSDISQIPTFLVSRMASDSVTVSLSGDAGDELFGGYNRYVLAHRFWGKIDRLPLRLRYRLSKLITSLPPEKWDALYTGIEKLVPRSSGFSNFGDKLHKISKALSSETIDSLYFSLLSHCDTPSPVVKGLAESEELLTSANLMFPELSAIERMMALDSMMYLPDGILTKVDRAAMGVSLETRVPLLDHRVVEFAWSLPLSQKIRAGEGKWLLRQILYKYVPKELIDRPKMGFAIPMGSWLRGPLRDWAESLIDETSLRREEFLKSDIIHEKWKEHISGRRNWDQFLWNVLMFQAWLRQR